MSHFKDTRSTNGHRSLDNIILHYPYHQHLIPNFDNYNYYYLLTTLFYLITIGLTTTAAKFIHYNQHRQVSQISEVSIHPGGQKNRKSKKTLNLQKNTSKLSSH